MASSKCPFCTKLKRLPAPPPPDPALAKNCSKRGSSVVVGLAVGLRSVDATFFDKTQNLKPLHAPVLLEVEEGAGLDLNLSMRVDLKGVGGSASCATSLEGVTIRVSPETLPYVVNKA